MVTNMALSDIIRETRKLAFIDSNGDRTWAPDLLIILTDTTSFNASPELISEVYFTSKYI